MSKGAKPWKLTEDESFSSFCSWKNTITYNLKKEDAYKTFLSEENEVQWEALTSANLRRGFTGDDAATKAADLNQMLGWVWSRGCISISPHKTNPLTSCSPPQTVKGLRSWIGAFKHLKACIPGSCSYLTLLESIVAGKESKSHITWTEDLRTAFTSAQEALKHPRTITIPKPTDRLIITTDASSSTGGIGAVLYIVRHNTTKLAGYFSAKLKLHQQKWLPCEAEALAISSAIDHWAPYILESKNPTQILSDSKPCVQAFKKLRRGQFSNSARISTFLSTLSRYNVDLQHISGSSNLPADFLSRQPADHECDSTLCQICKFIHEMAHSSVANVTVSDVLNGKAAMPYASPKTWKHMQQDCPTLRRAYSYLSQGTRPTKKMTTIKDVKRYLQVTSLSADGLIIVNKNIPFSGNRKLIVIPRHVLPGLLTALHLQFQHPSKLQLQKVFQRHYYALDLEKVLTNITTSCPQCAALATFPKQMVEYSSSNSSNIPGLTFASDIMCRAQQKIFVTRDTFSSYTTAKLIPNECADSLRQAIIETTAEMKVPQGTIIRVDNAPGFQPLIRDKVLVQLGISIEMGRVHNVNKNPIAEKAIQELEMELKKRHPTGSTITPANLAVAVSTLNSRIRTRGLSAREILYQRDGLTGETLHINDSLLASLQHDQRVANHEPSSRSKAQGKPATKASVNLGDLVFLKRDGTKHKGRERYIVSELNDDGFITIQKFASQFRLKRYKVKPSEIFKVPCSALTNVRNPEGDGETHPDSSSSELDSDDEGHSVVEAGGENDTGSRTITEQPQPGARARSPVIEETRPGARPRRAPPWMRSGDWNFT